MSASQINYQMALAQRLVLAVTDVEANSSNFQLCVDFVQANLKHHRFMETNERDVYRRCESLADKFEIFGQYDKARVFRELVERFRNGPMERGEAYDIHANLLALLLSLAQSPTHVPYRENTIEADEEEREPTWEEIIADDPLTGDHWESEISIDDQRKFASDSQYLWDEKDAEPFQAFWPKERRQSAAAAAAAAAEDTSTSTTQGNEPWWAAIQPTETGKGGKELANVAGAQYWPQGKGRPLTEIDVIHEVLWMLAGVPSSTIFDCSAQGTFKLKSHIWLSHLSTMATASSLEKLVATANKLVALRRMDASVWCTGRTLRSFHASVMQHVAQFEGFVSKLEEELFSHAALLRVENDGNMIWTFLHFIDKLDPQIRWIDELYSLASSVAATGTTTAEKSAGLLSVLHREMCLLAQPSSLHFSIFVDTIVPYSRILDDWVLRGKLEDVHEETFLSRVLPKDHSSKEWAGTLNLDGDGRYTACIPEFLTSSWKTIVETGTLARLASGMSTVSLSTLWTAALREHVASDASAARNERREDDGVDDAVVPQSVHLFRRPVQPGSSDVAELFEELPRLSSDEFKTATSGTARFGSPFRLLSSVGTVTTTELVPRMGCPDRLPFEFCSKEHIWLPAVRAVFTSVSRDVSGILDSAGLPFVLKTLAAVFLNQSPIALELFFNSVSPQVAGKLTRLLHELLDTHHKMDDAPIVPSIISAEIIQGQLVAFSAKLAWPLNLVISADDLRLYGQISLVLQRLRAAILLVANQRPTRHETRRPLRSHRSHLARLEIDVGLHTIGALVYANVIAVALDKWEKSLEIAEEATIDRLIANHREMLGRIAKGLFIVQAVEGRDKALAALLQAPAQLPSVEEDDLEDFVATIHDHVKLVQAGLSQL